MYQFNDIYVSESILFSAIMSLKHGEKLKFVVLHNNEVIEVTRILQDLKYSTNNFFYLNNKEVYPFEIYNVLVSFDKYAYQ